VTGGSRGIGRWISGQNLLATGGLLP